MDVIEELVRCPRCHHEGVRRVDSDAPCAVCPSCEQSYPMVGGVLDLIPGAENELRGLHWIMDSWFARFNEGRLFRQNPLFHRLQGLRFKDELRLTLEAADLKGAEIVLDVGCGSGNFTRPLAMQVPGGYAAGVDLSPRSLLEGARERRRLRVGNMELIHGTALDLPFGDGRFDVVNCSGTFHILPDKERALRELYRVLAPGGRLVLGTFRLPPGRLWGLGARVTRALFGLEPNKPHELQARLSKAGFREIRWQYSNRTWALLGCRKAM